MSRSKSTKEDLVRIYSAFIRPVVEYASVVYGPLLNSDMTKRIESLQKTALKFIHGSKPSYAALLEKSNIQSLEKRRSDALSKFAIKNLKNDRFSTAWFPQNTRGILRHTEK